MSPTELKDWLATMAMAGATRVRVEWDDVKIEADFPVPGGSGQGAFEAPVEPPKLPRVSFRTEPTK